MFIESKGESTVWIRFSKKTEINRFSINFVFEFLDKRQKISNTLEYDVRKLGEDWIVNIHKHPREICGVQDPGYRPNWEIVGKKAGKVEISWML